MELDQDALSVIADHFNSELFNRALPHASVRITKAYPGMLGAYVGRHLSGTGDQILFNDELHRRDAPGFITACVTVAHELTHQWATGQDPKNYYQDSGHTPLWFIGMYRIGLRSTWARSESGAMTTRDEIIPNGKFLAATLRLAGHFRVTA